MDCWYGFKLSDSLLRLTAMYKSHHTTDGYAAILPQGTCGCVAIRFQLQSGMFCAGRGCNTQPEVQFVKPFDWSLTTIDDVQW